MHISSEIGSAASLWLLAPILAIQGLYVKKKTPRLPGAAGPTTGSLPGLGRAVRLLAIGESSVAGVGAPDHASGLTGKTATALFERTGRAVQWRAVGKIGVTARAARRKLLPQVPRWGCAPAPWTSQRDGWPGNSTALPIAPGASN